MTDLETKLQKELAKADAAMLRKEIADIDRQMKKLQSKREKLSRELAEVQKRY